MPCDTSRWLRWLVSPLQMLYQTSSIVETSSLNLYSLDWNVIPALRFAHYTSKHSRTCKGRRVDIINWCRFLFFWMRLNCWSFLSSTHRYILLKKKKYVGPRATRIKFSLENGNTAVLSSYSTCFLRTKTWKGPRRRTEHRLGMCFQGTNFALLLHLWTFRNLINWKVSALANRVSFSLVRSSYKTQRCYQVLAFELLNQVAKIARTE